MTCIVGLVQDGKVYIGGDSAGVGDYHLVIRKDKKVFRNGNYLIGGTTSFRMLQLLKFSFIPPEVPASMDLECYMATKFVDAVRECFKSGGYAQKNSEQESGGSFLIGYQGRLFQIHDDYQVQEALSAYDAVGCGRDAALGVLYATPDMQPIKRIELALKAAEQYTIGVRGPFYWEHS